MNRPSSGKRLSIADLQDESMQVVVNGRPSKTELYGEVNPPGKLALIMHQAAQVSRVNGVTRPITALLNKG